MLRSADFTDLNSLRRELRRIRKGLSATQQKHNSLTIAHHASELLASRNDLNVGAFNAFNGEPDLSTLLLALGDRAWLPIVDAHSNTMTFAQGDGARENRFGIDEPSPSATIEAKQLSMILVPMVGYDHDCNRIGMGKGFYDRALAEVSDESLLVGIAHSCQQVDELAPQTWDIQLDCIITENGIIQRRGRPQKP